MVPDQAQGWRFYAGTTTGAQRKRLRRFISSRSRWAARHHGWAAEPGKAVLGATLLGAATGWVFGPVGWLLGPLTGVAFATVVMVPLARAANGAVVWWHLRYPGTRVAHWCEGPNGELAIRMTTPRPASNGTPECWYGMNLFGIDGAGRRLLLWLQHLVDQRGAVLVIRTTQPWLVDYYQRVGFGVVRQPRLRLGHRVQVGATVLQYPADTPGKPVRQRRSARALPTDPKRAPSAQSR